MFFFLYFSGFFSLCCVYVDEEPLVIVALGFCDTEALFESLYVTHLKYGRKLPVRTIMKLHHGLFITYAFMKDSRIYQHFNQVSLLR